MVREIKPRWRADPAATGLLEHYHTDTIGSTRLMSGGAGSDFPGYAIPGTEASYTAFGQRECTLDGTCDPADAPHRFGYAGTYGYQTHEEFPFLHVGARYYDSALARFLQRDPIGIFGGANVYEYVGSVATALVDPSGLAGAAGPSYGYVPAPSGRTAWGGNDAAVFEWHARHEGTVVLATFGMAGAAVGELTCAAMGLGWWWRTDKFRTGDLFKKVWEGIEQLHDGPSASPAPPAPNRSARLMV